MAFTYDSTLSNDKDKVRFIIGDNDNDRQLLQDEEIDAALTIKTTVLRAAVFCCEHLALRYARKSEERSGDMIADLNDISEKYRRRAIELKQKGVKGLAHLEPSSKDDDRDDANLIQTDISRGMHNNV